jgi:hypothetical protein
MVLALKADYLRKGQTERNSVRAYVFRFALELEHRSMQSALRMCQQETHAPQQIKWDRRRSEAKCPAFSILCHSDSDVECIAVDGV